MSTELLQQYAQGNPWLSLAPEILLLFIAFACLIAEMVGGKNHRLWVGKMSISLQAILLSVFFFLLSDWDNSGEILFNGLIQQNANTDLFRFLFLIIGVLTSFLGLLYFRRNDLPRTEFFAIVPVLTAGLMLLSQTHHFLFLFVVLELVTIGFYVLVAYGRHRSASLEAGLKYLIMGGVSSATLLFGIVLLYGLAGNPEWVALHPGDPFSFTALQTFVAGHASHPLVIIATLLILSGIAFKIGAFPFQIWIPDVYQGAPTPTTAFLGVGSKAGGFVLLLLLVQGPFAPLEDLLLPLLTGVTAATLLFGNLAALSQRNVKRLMGLSGVAHAGFLLIIITASFQFPYAAAAALFFYLLVYALASFAVFGVMLHLAPEGRDDFQEMIHYQDLFKYHPFLGMVLTVGLGSLAGIPPFAGFIAKLVVFYLAWQAQLWVLLGVAICGVVISIYYYFGWIKEATFKFWRLPGNLDRDPDIQPPVLSLTLGTRLVLMLLVGATILIGIYPAPLQALFAIF